MKDKMLCWPLFGTGLDKLGEDHKPCEWDIPEPGPDQLLVRIEAIGLCFSDVKLIRAGEDHPRVVSKDLSTDPVIPGHEAVMRVVRVGSDVQDRFRIGERFIIQADIDVNGENIAYGYAINGGMAEYSLIDQRVLSGDEGCYLLPLKPDTPAGLAALIEPWTCVIASYMIEHRTAIEPGGRLLVAQEPGDTETYVFGSGAAPVQPAQVDCLDVSDGTRAALRTAFPNAVFSTVRDIPCGPLYTDIAICGVKTPDLGQVLGKLGDKNALISFVGDYSHEDQWLFDVGSIHYKGWFYQGAAGRDIAAAYGRNVRTKLRKGGTCWLSGGAGAMGQMHTQLAVEDPDGPLRILVTDLEDERIHNMVERLKPTIEERGIEFLALNPKSFESPEALNQVVREFAPDGFDDVVMLVPVPAVLSSSVPFMGRDSLMNIFAGIPAGKETTLNIGDIVNNGARYVGSSGSRTYHLQHTLDLAQSGRLNTAPALAAIGGMRALWEGIEGVANARFPGKTVIFPNCEHMPLTAVSDLADLVPGVEDTLDSNGYYSLETERALVAKFETNSD
jgi:threonine dehydrogenase-like Zn-dependent dehydrogenase